MVDWEWYSDANVFRVFIHLLLTANHETKKWRGIEVKRGQRITSYQHLGQELGIGVQSVRTAIKKLILTGELTHTGNSQYSLITILNWETYQGDNTPSNTRPTSNQQATNKQLTTNKNVKNDKNEKKQYGEFLNILLSVEEHQKLTTRYGTSAIKTLIEECSTYQKSAGKKYSDHYATLLNWAKRKGLVEVPKPTVIKQEEAQLTPEQVKRNEELRAQIRGVLPGSKNLNH